MRLLIDENLSPRLSVILAEGGHDAEHVSKLGLTSASDSEVFKAARQQDRILLSADTDFGTLLAASRATGPSLILIRRTANRRALELAALIEANLSELASDLRQGCVVVFDAGRIRIRRLPLV